MVHLAKDRCKNVAAVCAAPGSKTFQLLEMIHRGVNSGELSDGMVCSLTVLLIANHLHKTSGELQGTLSTFVFSLLLSN